MKKIAIMLGLAGLLCAGCFAPSPPAYTGTIPVTDADIYNAYHPQTVYRPVYAPPPPVFWSCSGGLCNTY